MTRLRALLGLGLLIALSGCGGSPEASDTEPPTRPIADVLEQAADVDPETFPAADGKTLQEIADEADPGPQLGLATSVYEPGDNRFAFGLIDAQNRFVYGKTVLYFAAKASAKATGPIVARPDGLIVDAPYRSAGATEGDAISAIYNAELPLERPGQYEVLSLTQLPQGLFGATEVIKVQENRDIPNVGEPAPKVETDTLASAGGNVEAIDTRVPPDTMHGSNFADVVGEKPVALIMSTPALCESRVCGPVTDIAEQLKADYGDQMEFIHQEVFIDNDPTKGLRPPLEAFGLQTEPWLFVIGSDGRVTARLEGSFGITQFREAVESAL